MFRAVKAFVLAILPLDDQHVIQGLGNRTPMPVGPFVALTSLANARLRTNQTTWDVTDPAPTDLSIEQGVQITLQVDIYGPLSFDWATIFTTLWRDDFGCTALAPACQPLYTDDPKQIPLVDGEEQYEKRWLLTSYLEYVPVVSTPSQFADTLAVTLINVDVEYPP